MAAMRLLGLLLVIPLLLTGGPVPASPSPTVGVSRQSASAGTTKVVIVTLDSVGSRAVRLAGRKQAPTLHRLLREGAGTLNARTVREETLTLPNHTTMVTGRRVDAEHSGHGVWWNDERTDPRTVQEAASHDVSSVFRIVASDSRQTGLFVSKKKLSLFETILAQGRRPARGRGQQPASSRARPAATWSSSGGR